MNNTLLIDGECQFCLKWAEWGRRTVRPAATLTPYQHVDLGSLGVSIDECASAVQWIVDGDRIASGGEAVAHLLATGRQPWAGIGRAFQLPLLRGLVDQAYRAVARHRHQLPAPPFAQLAS